MAKGLVVEHSDDEVAIYLLPSVGCVFQYFLSLSQQDTALRYVALIDQLDCFTI